MKKNNLKLKVLVMSLITVFLVALIGSFFTSKNTNTPWYESIKPEITPPSYVFPIVWNTLFFLIALSLYFSWINKTKNKKVLALAFGINFFLNILWSYLFFYLKQIRLAFFEIIILEISIIYLIIYTYKIDKKASYLLIPYLIWVGFASVLNYLAAFR